MLSFFASSFLVSSFFLAAFFLVAFLSFESAGLSILSPAFASEPAAWAKANDDIETVSASANINANALFIFSFSFQSCTRTPEQNSRFSRGAENCIPPVQIFQGARRAFLQRPDLVTIPSGSTALESLSKMREPSQRCWSSNGSPADPPAALP